MSSLVEACVEKPRVAAWVLVSVGYKQVSRAFRTVARLDISEGELKSFLARELFWPEDRVDDMFGRCRWDDHYRRCYSQDVIENVPEEVMMEMRKLRAVA